MKAFERFIIQSDDIVPLTDRHWDSWLKMKSIIEVDIKDFKEKSDHMSNNQVPTINQVVPFYVSLIRKLNGFLRCKENVLPDYAELVRAGKPEELVKATKKARDKL